MRMESAVIGRRWLVAAIALGMAAGCADDATEVADTLVALDSNTGEDTASVDVQVPDVADDTETHSVDIPPDMFVEDVPDTGPATLCPNKATMPAVTTSDVVGNLVLSVVKQGGVKTEHSLYDSCEIDSKIKYIWLMRATTVCAVCLENFALINAFHAEFSDEVMVWLIIENPQVGLGIDNCAPNTPTNWENLHHEKAGFPILHDCKGAVTATFFANGPDNGRAVHYIIDAPAMSVVSTTDVSQAESSIIDFLKNQLAAK
ncbi:MAG: hypothetical protein ACI9OJ_005363 [Myxococcota bacterium]|jgi:hypothetical protein